MRKKLVRQGGWWFVQWREDGVLLEEPAGTTDYRAAIAFLRRGTAPRSHETMSFVALAELMGRQYTLEERKSLERVTRILRDMRNYFGDILLSELTTSKILAYVTERLKHYARGTVKLELRVLHRALTLAREHEWITEIPRFPKVRDSSPRKGFFEDVQLEEILRHLTAPYVPVVRFLSITGWRLREAIGLQWFQVDFVHGSVRIEETKNQHAREFPFRAYPPLETLLRDQREKVCLQEKARNLLIPWVFPSRRGRRITQIWVPWDRARKAAGYPAALIHDLRRTVVRRLERAGVPRKTAMAITGHRTESIYSRYDIVDDRDLSEGVARVWRYVSRRD